ncbi:MAG TPA: adenylate cyclase [Epulopiscium sp.]|nr:adenylate cyclase [Candidatus Epulonipiscium sp.]
MEIERKFLINKLPNLWEFPSENIEQFYISINPEVRIRHNKKGYFLTVKSEGGLKRKEIEIDINECNYKELKLQYPNLTINKTRYYIPYEKNVCELDIYHNINSLITVEVEFKSVSHSAEFKKPNWFGSEITNIQEFKNKSLAKHGFPTKLKCPVCRGKCEIYDRYSMGHYLCNDCVDGEIEFSKVVIDNYNKLIKDS